MKALVLAALLASPTLLAAQSRPTYNGPEVGAPQKGVATVIVHTTDSGKVAYAAAVRGLLSAGYGLDRQEASVGFVSSTAKLLPTGSGVRLLVQASVSPTPTGCDITYRGLFTWASVLAQGTSLENQQLPAVYTAGGNSPTQRAWNGLQQVATESFPKAKFGYK